MVSKRRVDRLLVEQGGRCAICQVELPPEPKVDRSRDGQVRGILCRSCCTGLGVFDEDAWRLAAAVRYLDTHRLDPLEDEPATIEPTGAPDLTQAPTEMPEHIRQSVKEVLQETLERRTNLPVLRGRKLVANPPRPRRKALTRTASGAEVDLADPELPKRLEGDPRLKAEVDDLIAGITRGKRRG